jgi:hypothetical protein
MSKYCECTGSARERGFTNIGPKDSPWWVCSGCMLPTRAYAMAMLHPLKQEPTYNER